MKDEIQRSWWLVAIVLVAVFLLFLSFSGQSSKPKDEDELPPAESPPST